MYVVVQYLVAVFAWVALRLRLMYWHGLDDFAGESVKRKVTNAVSRLLAPGATNNRGVLLFGETGSGKTMIGESLRSFPGVDAFVDATYLISVPSEEIPRKLQQTFDDIIASGKTTILWIDHVDAVLGQGDIIDTVTVSIAHTFMTSMDKLRMGGHKVVVVGATIYPEKIPHNVMERFDAGIYVSPPQTIEEFERIVAVNVTKRNDGRHLNPVEIRSVAEIAAQRGLRGSDVVEVVNRAYGETMFEDRDVFDNACEKMRRKQ